MFLIHFERKEILFMSLIKKSEAGRIDIRTVPDTKTTAKIKIISFAYPITYAPIIDIVVSAIKSVSLSAMITGADLLIDVPFNDFRKYDFRTSPIFPGVTAIANPETNIPRLSPVETFIFSARR